MYEDDLSKQYRQQQHYEASSSSSSTSRESSPSSSLVAAFVTKTNVTEPVGIELDIMNGDTIITEIEHDSLAYHTDLRPGMIVKSINHVECHGKTIPQVRHLLATAIPSIAILAEVRDYQKRDHHLSKWNPYGIGGGDGGAAAVAPVSETMYNGNDPKNDVSLSDDDERPPPPGLPSGGYWIVNNYTGVTTMVAFFVGCFCFYGLGPLACCCPCDQRIEYVLDGAAYSTEVSLFILFSPANQIKEGCA